MSPSITLLFVEVPVRTNDHHSIVVQIGFFWLGTLIKYKNLAKPKKSLRPTFEDI